MKYIIFGVSLLLASCSIAQAGYLVTTTVQDLGDSYEYSWSVYNVDQGQSGKRAGLDGWFVLVPAYLVVLSYTCPSSPNLNGSFGVWNQDVVTEAPGIASSQAPDNYEWLGFWGYDWGSMYAPGMTATFVLQTDKKYSPGVVSGDSVTFWGDLGSYYTGVSCTTLGPVVPEPSSILVVLCGIGAMGGLIRRRKSA